MRFSTRDPVGGEQSSESGTKEDDVTEMNGHIFLIDAGADILWLHGQAILLIEVESLQRRSRMTLLLYARSAGNGISKDSGVRRSRYPHGVCPYGAIERGSH